MGAAIDVSADKLAFIKGGVPSTPMNHPNEESTTIEVSVPTAIVASDVQSPVDSPQTPATIELEKEVEEGDSPDSVRRRTRPRSKRENAMRDEPMLGLVNMLVPLTTRLSPSTAAALKRAGLEQKLYGRHPGTVQEIAEEAINDWLKGQGYL
jgi:hypothetical protein